MKIRKESPMMFIFLEDEKTFLISPREEES
jgi:hypothetical protein